MPEVSKAHAVVRPQDNPYVTDIARRKYATGDPTSDIYQTGAYAFISRGVKKRAAPKKTKDANAEKAKAGALARHSKFSRCMCRLIPPTCTVCDELALQTIRGRALYHELMKQPTVSLEEAGIQ